MHKNIPLGLVLASAMAITTLAMAAPSSGHPHGGWHSHGHAQFMAFKKLGLTDAQRSSIKQIMKASFAANRTQRKALAQQRTAFETMTPDQVGYQAAASNLAQVKGDAMRTRVLQQANVRAQVYAVLTPTQKAELATLQTQRQVRRQQWAQFKAQHSLPSDRQTTPPAQ